MTTNIEVRNIITSWGWGWSGTVTSVSIITANWVSWSVATATTTPAISLTLGDITPTSVVSSWTVTGTNLSGTNTWDDAVNSNYSSDYRLANFIAGTDYLTPSWSGTWLTGIELISNKATTFWTINDTLYPTVKAVNDAITSSVVWLLDYRGSYNASTNLYPSTWWSWISWAVLKWDFWICSVAWILWWTSVTAWDLIIALIDTPAQTSSNWDLISHDINYVPENTANKVTSISWASTDIQYPTAKLLYDQLALKGDMTLASVQTNSWTKTFLDATILFRNIANTFSSWFTNTNTAARTYTLKDSNGTIAFTSDITGTNSGTNTWDITLAWTPNYITIAWQVITRALIDLANHVTWLLPFANIANVATWTVMYRKTAATWAMEAQTLATLKTDLGLTWTNSGDQTITLTWWVTWNGTGSFATTVVTNANLTGTVTSVGNATSIAAWAISNAMLTNGAVANLSWTNTGDNSTNSTYASDYRAANFVAWTNYVAPWSITTDWVTMNTARILWRTTASSWAVEEITVWSGLSLSAWTLTATWGGWTTITTQDEWGTLSSTVTTLNFTGAWVTASWAWATTTINIPWWAWSFTVTETEIDFGSWVPVRSKKFTITDAWVSWTSKIMVTSSWSTATWRVWDDYEWDSINFTAKAWTWNFTLTALGSWRLRGKRKILYTF